MADQDPNSTSTTMLAATAGATGPRLFEATARTLGEHLGARWTFVCELIAPDRARTLAAFENGEPMGTFEYDLEKTPCAEVLTRDACAYTSGVTRQFPEDRYLTELGVESYLGIGIRSAAGEQLGVLVAMHDAPKFDQLEDLQTLELFAMRVGAEIERLRLERALAQHDKLESLGALAGGIAHDFNNLLVAILANVDHARGLLGDGEPEVREALDDAARATHAASEMTQQLLAYAGRQERTPRSLDLGALAAETARLFDNALPKGATCLVTAAEDLRPVTADATQLRQIVMNLLTNAAEALQGAAGAVRLRAANAAKDDVSACPCAFRAERFDEQAAHVVLEVSDDGVGMDEHQLAHMFDPFWSSKGERRGLGLSTVLGILRSHDGAISFDSQPGEGTTVRVFLPAATIADAPAPEQAPRAGGGAASAAGRRVLVVDDNEVVRSTLRRALVRLGCSVLEADGGEAAVALFEREADTLDGAIVDLMMPGMRGDELASRLRALDPAVPIAITTGFDDGAPHGREHVAAMLLKPWTIVDLEALLRDHLERR